MPLLRLLRLPGVFTALADVLAGYLLVRLSGAGAGLISSLPFALGASACLYMAGMAWNDVFDLETDRQSRPERPIPSGLIRLSTAFMIAAVLSLAGLLLAMRAGYQTFLVASVLLCLILLYDAGVKRIEIIGPVVMGTCRGLNLVLGMSVHAHVLLLLANPVLHLPPLLLLLYTTVITILSAMEAAPEKPAATPGAAVEAAAQDPVEAIVLIPGILALLAVPAAAAWMLPPQPLALGLFGLLVLVLGPPAIQALRTRTQSRMRALVGTAIMGMVILDGGFVASVTTPASSQAPWVPLAMPAPEGVAAVVLVVAMALPALILKRRIAVT